MAGTINFGCHQISGKHDTSGMPSFPFNLALQENEYFWVKYINISGFCSFFFFITLLQKYLLEQQAVLDVDGGKLLNEEHDIRSVSFQEFL